LSMKVPVVVDLWASAGPGSGGGGAELSDLLVRLSAQSAGRWVLARIDVAANPRIAQAFGVQGAPAVFAVLKGQPVPLFSEALPEPAVRQYLDELLRVAQANGVSGQVGPVSAADQAPPTEELVEPELDEAYDAIERDDLDGAAEAYRRLLNRKPADATAQAGLAQVELLRRSRSLDPAAVRRDAADRPDDVQAQARAADLDVLGGHVEDAFARLVELVRRTTGEDRQLARTHLVELFEIIGAGDPRVAKARTALANALF
jgi:putative thioredoxin